MRENCRASRNKSPLVSKALEANCVVVKKNNCVKWGAINIALLGMITYDLSWKCPYHTTTLHYIEYLLAVIFLLNILYHFIAYVYYAFTLSPVTVTPHQKKLLGLDNDSSFKYKSAPEERSNADDKSPLMFANISNRSSMSVNSSLTDSVNQSMSSPSWIYVRGSPQYQPQRLDFSWQNNTINDENSLQEYLKNAEEKEKMTLLNNSLENSPKDTNLFWNHPSTRSVKEMSPIFKKTQYQLAPLNSEIPHMLGMNDESSPKSLQSSPQVWQKLHIDSQQITQWNANIRKWISSTILDCIVKEIKSIDDAFLKCGLTDVRIGHVGLDRLKKIASSQIIQHIPTLSILVPFMEISTNQEYLVQRIKELSSGGCMSDFKWNSGGNLHGKSWDESLPTDSAVVMHFFATYLDTQLMPVTQNPEGLPFTSQHFCKIPEKPIKNQDSLIIHQTSINPPHYLLIIGEETCEISKGRNNLIHTLLLFLHTVANKHHGMLGRVNLGKSGVNVLWVIDQ